MPHNPKAEAGVLGGVLLDSRCFAEVAGQLEPTDFYKEAHRHIWRAMAFLATKGTSVDVVTLSHELRAAGTLQNAGGSAYLVQLQNETPGAANVAAYAQIVHDAAICRALIDASRYAGEEVWAHWEAREQVEGIASEAQRRLGAALEPLLKTQAKGVGCETWGQTMTRVFHELEHPGGDQAAVTTITTTFDELDREVEFPVGPMTVIAARPAVGKSALFSDLLYEYGVRGMQPHGWCLEDDKQILATRVLAQRSGVDARRVRDLRRYGPQSADEARDHELLFAHVAKLMEVGATWNDTPELTVEQIRMEARERVRQGAQILLLDHALKIRHTPGTGKDTREKLNHIIGQLSAMGRELHVPLIVFTQLKRIDGDRPPIISDLKETGKWEEDARVVLFLHRSIAEKGAASKPQPAHVIVAKANHDRQGAWVRLMFDPRRLLWRAPTIAEQRTIASNGADQMDDMPI